ncbi:MAG: hypothetical protein M0030_11345 [Actinomycetota bacterium]|nr:hypothetical protein [Actinomycetota bacterium]
METGIIRQLPSGEFIEETRPVSDEVRARLARPSFPELPAAEADADADVPAPSMRKGMGRVRARLNKIVSESVPASGNGHGGNGHGGDGGHAIENGSVPAAIGAAEHGGADDHQEGSR